MRAFIALELPDEIKKEIANIQKQLEIKDLFSGKLTSQENLHLTLKFLGEISENTAEEARKKLSEIKFKKFSASLGELGIFNENFIRIIWIKLDNCGELQKEIDEKLSGLFSREERFMSHLTIARVNEIKDKKKLIDKLGRINYKKKKFQVSEFKLKKSTLTQGGPIYEDLEGYLLK